VPAQHTVEEGVETVGLEIFHDAEDRLFAIMPAYRPVIEEADVVLALDFGEGRLQFDVEEVGNQTVVTVFQGKQLLRLCQLGEQFRRRSFGQCVDQGRKRCDVGRHRHADAFGERLDQLRFFFQVLLGQEDQRPETLLPVGHRTEDDNVLHTARLIAWRREIIGAKRQNAILDAGEDRTFVQGCTGHSKISFASSLYRLRIYSTHLTERQEHGRQGELTIKLP
jgi:hypothetical protein